MENKEREINHLKMKANILFNRKMADIDLFTRNLTRKFCIIGINFYYNKFL